MKNTANIILILFVLVSNSCQQTNSDKIYGLSISGSSTVYPVTSLIVFEYQSVNKNFDIFHSVTGSNDAFKRFIVGDLLFANASRQITEEERLISEQNGVSFQEYVIGYDGITLLANSENDWIDFLTYDELRSIWREDGYRYWSDIRPDWPNKFILKYGPGEESGTLSFFQNAILEEDSLAENYINSLSDEILVNGIGKDLYSMGFLGLAYHKKHDDKVKRIPFDTGGGPILPDGTTIKNGTYKLLSRPLFVYVNSKVISSKDGKKFLQYFFENVAYAIETVGYVPLESQEYTELVEQFR